MEIYSKLVDALNSRGRDVSAKVGDAYFAFIKEVFTEEQAAVASVMPTQPIPAEDLVTYIPGADPDKLKATLEGMADCGLVLASQKQGKTFYELLPLAPGIIEFQFLRGQDDERTRRIALLFKDYMKSVGWGKGDKSSTPTATATPVAKKIINTSQDVPEQIATILPLQEAIKFIMETDHIVAGSCHCRQVGQVLDRPCDKPRNNMCMIIGSGGELASMRGLVGKLSRDEAKHALEEADNAGLIHNYIGRDDLTIKFLCNCCSCHCAVVKGIVRSPLPSKACIADWMVNISNEDCIGCEACIERCYTKALKMKDDLAVHDPLRCIGCGLCIPVCPTNAISLVKR